MKAGWWDAPLTLRDLAEEININLECIPEIFEHWLLKYCILLNANKAVLMGFVAYLSTIFCKVYLEFTRFHRKS